MKHVATLLFLILLTGCAQLVPSKATSGNADEMLLKGIHQLTSRDSSATLQKLIKQHPKSPQAEAAQKLLKACGKKKEKGGQADLEKLRLENQRLQEDLEQLRQLLIKSEKRAS